MPVRSAHVTAVLQPLPAALVRELDTAEVAERVDALVAAGWRPGQLAHRLAGQPAQGSVERDAALLRALLQALGEQVPPDVAHARELEERRRARAREPRHAPATPMVRERALTEIRAQLKGLPARRRDVAPRVRPACCLCGGEGRFYVTRDVHLCPRCVEVLATGEARLTVCG